MLETQFPSDCRCLASINILKTIAGTIGRLVCLFLFVFKNCRAERNYLLLLLLYIHCIPILISYAKGFAPFMYFIYLC